MKKISYFKLILALMLVGGSLVGCTPDNSLNTSQNNNPQSEQIDCSKQSDKISIYEAYSNFNNAQAKLLENLKLVVNDDQLKSSTNSSKSVECLKKLQEAIKIFEIEELLKLDKNNQDSIKIILKDINSSIDDILTKVLEPLKDGLNDTAVTKVQENLNLDITQAQKGKFVSKTLGGIESFLLAKSESLPGKIRDLNFYQLSAQLTSLEQENQKLKKTYTLAFLIAILAILISVFKDVGIKYIGKFTKRGKSQDHKPPRNSESMPISEQVYNQIYNQLYDQLYQPLEQMEKKISNLDRQMDKRIDIKINSSVNDLEQRLETKIKKSSSSRKEEIREPQTKIPTWQDKQTPRNQTPAAYTSQVSNLSTSQWINTYNHNPDLLSRNVTEVSETEESVNNRRLGSSQAVILAKKSRGNYWVLTEGSYDYLVPSQSLRINEHNYKTVEALFECRNYHPDYSSDFQLLKPAVVVPLSGGKTWQLQEAGILQF